MCEPGNRDNGASDVWALTAYSMRASKSLENSQGPTASPAGPRSNGTARFAKVSPDSLVYNSLLTKILQFLFILFYLLALEMQVSSG